MNAVQDVTRLTLLHGFTGTSRSWDGVRRSLPDFTGELQAVATPSLLGHSLETLNLPVSTFADEVNRLAEIIASDGPRHHLCGYSLGGRVALGLLASRPELFVRATIISAHPGLESDAEREERIRTDEHWCMLLERDGIEAFVDKWQNLPLFASQRRLPAALQQAQREERLGHSPRGLAHSLRVTGLGRMPSYWPALASMAMPITLIVGELDDKFLRIAEQVKEMLPRARLVVVPNAGHNVTFEAPEGVAAELAQ